MNAVIEAIKSRRSVRKLLADPPVSKEQVETIIEAAIWAPNHYLTEPWRFVVLTGDERRKLGDAMSTALMNTSTKSPTQERLDIERNRPQLLPIAHVEPGILLRRGGDRVKGLGGNFRR